MTERVSIEGLAVDEVLFNFVEHEPLPGSGIESGRFWSALAELVRELREEDGALLARRAEL